MTARQPSRNRPASTLAGIFRLLRPSIPPTLLDGEGWQRVLDCARGLPAAAAQIGFGLECRLDAPEPAADLGLLTGPGCAVSAELIARGEAPQAEPASASLSRLFKESRREGCALSRAVSGITLEFDIARAAAPGKPPGVFLAPPEFTKDGRGGYTDPDRLAAALAGAGHVLHSADRRMIEAVFAALPPGAHVAQGGLFPGRRPVILRLNVGGVEMADTPAFLERAGWPGVPDRVVGTLSDCRDLTP